MATPITVIGTQTIDQSGSYSPILLTLGSTLIVQRDGGTPGGDPVVANLSGLSAIGASTVLVQGGATAQLTGLAGIGLLANYQIGSSGTLELLSSVGVNLGTQITFTGTNGTLAVDQSSLNLSLLGSVSGFTSSDIIDFRGVAAATSATYQGGVVTLLNGATTVASLTVSGTASNATLSVISDGKGGFEVGDNLGINGPRLSGSSSQYTIAVNSPATDIVTDSISGRDATTTPITGSLIGFSDGVGFIDPSGAAEQIARLYQSLLDRQADAGGLSYFASLVSNHGASVSDIARGIIASPEYQMRFGAQTNSQYVSQLYQNIGQSVDGNGNALVAALDAGVNRGIVATTFANQLPAVQATISYAGSATESESYRLYETVLGRGPDQGGLANFLTAYNNGATSSQVAAIFTSSTEFVAKFGSISNTDFVNQLYENVFHRTADATGLTTWTNALASGGTRADVALGIADSLEARTDTAAATHDGWILLPHA